MVKLTDLVRLAKYPIYAVLPFVLGCGSADYSPNFDKSCLDRARDEAVYLSIERVGDKAGFCKSYGHNLIFALQRCLGKSENRTYNCLRIQNGEIVDEDSFAEMCSENVEDQRPLDDSIDYWCAEFHEVPDE